MADCKVVNVCFTSGGTCMHFSRKELLMWLNKTLKSSFSKIDHLCTGAAYCQLMDILFPNCINLQRVKFESSLEYEFIHNYKILQGAFQQLSVSHTIPIEKLVKGRFQDNLEFLQWFKKFFDANYTKKDYDASAVRRGAPIAFGPPVKSRGSKGRTGGIHHPPTRTLFAALTSKKSSIAKFMLRHRPSDVRRASSQKNVTPRTEASLIPRARILAPQAPVRPRRKPGSLQTIENGNDKSPSCTEEYALGSLQTIEEKKDKSASCAEENPLGSLQTIEEGNYSQQAVLRRILWDLCRQSKRRKISQQAVLRRILWDLCRHSKREMISQQAVLRRIL